MPNHSARRGPRALAAAMVDHDNPGAALLRRLQPAHVVGRGIGRRVGPPDQDQIGIVEVFINAAQMLAEAGARRDHALRGIAERADARRIRRTEGEEHGIGRGFGRAGRAEGFAKPEFEIAAAGIDGGGFRAVSWRRCRAGRRPACRRPRPSRCARTAPRRARRFAFADRECCPANRRSPPPARRADRRSRAGGRAAASGARCARPPDGY